MNTNKETPKEQFNKLKDLIQVKNIDINIISDSMLPLLKINDKLTISKIISPLEIWQIVVFLNHEDKLTCHYVYGKSNLEENVYYTRPLNRKYQSDLPLKSDHLLGVVINKPFPFYFKIYALLFCKC